MEPSGVWCVCQGLLPGERTMRWTLPSFSSKWNHVVEREQRKKINAAQLPLVCSFSFIAVVMLDRLSSLCFISRQTGRLHHDGDSDQNVPFYIFIPQSRASNPVLKHIGRDISLFTSSEPNSCSLHLHPVWRPQKSARLTAEQFYSKISFWTKWQLITAVDLKLPTCLFQIRSVFPQMFQSHQENKKTLS